MQQQTIDLKQLELIDLIDMQVNMQQQASTLNQNLQVVNAEILRRTDEHRKAKQTQDKVIQMANTPTTSK